MTDQNLSLVQPTTDHAIQATPEQPKLAAAPKEAKKDYALITGASSGIGEAFAKVLAAKKKPLILIGKNEAKLKTLAEELRAREGIDVRFLPIDLARSKELPLLPGKLQNMGITVDVLINNAGFGKYGQESEIRYEDDLNMVNLNCRAVLALTKLFLPSMLARRKGAIINVASTAGFFPWPTMTTYAATKAFVISYSQGLAEELKGKGVKVLCTCPGPVATSFQERAGLKVDPNDYKRYSDPQTIVEKTLEALKSNKSLVIVGNSTSWTKWALKLLPRSLFIKLV
ncbi:MAG: SDR family NAD(P)-dependent oxidoreductase [Patescibacteria group bacterium]